MPSSDLFNNRLNLPKLNFRQLSLRILFLGAIYYSAAKVGLQFAIINLNITAVWPPSGIALAAIFLMGRWAGLGIFLGALSVNYTLGTPLFVAFGIAVGNTLAALFAAELLLRIKDFRTDFSRIKDIFIFFILGVMLGPLISATIGILSLSNGGLLNSSNTLSAWLVWWSGDAIGILVFTPLVLVLRTLKWQMPPLERALEFIFLVGLFLAIAVFAFTSNDLKYFLIYPFVIWAAIRFHL